MSGSERVKLMKLEFTEDKWVSRPMESVHKRA